MSGALPLGNRPGRRAAVIHRRSGGRPESRQDEVVETPVACDAPGEHDPGRNHEHDRVGRQGADRKSTRLNSSHVAISYAVFCLKKKKKVNTMTNHTKMMEREMRQRHRELQQDGDQGTL